MIFCISLNIVHSPNQLKEMLKTWPALFSKCRFLTVCSRNLGATAVLYPLQILLHARYPTGFTGNKLFPLPPNLFHLFLFFLNPSAPLSLDRNRNWETLCTKFPITWQCCFHIEEGVLFGGVTIYCWGRLYRADDWGGVTIAQCVEMSCFVERNNDAVLGSHKGNIGSIRVIITERNAACNITFIAGPQNE